MSRERNIAKIKSAIELLRIPQWSKNTFMFLPLFFGGKLFDINLFADVLIAFGGFSLIASSVYVFNDWVDVGFDRLHPQKKNRALASGMIRPGEAAILGSAVFITGLAVMFWRIKNPLVYILLGIYILQNILYTLKLKQFAILDISIIAMGFVIRVLMGGAVTDVKLSYWLVILTFLLALFLAFSKRREDVILKLKTNEKLRKNIDDYNLEFLNASMIVTSTIVIVAYIMYTTSMEVVNRISEYIYITSFFVVISIFRFLQLTFVKEISGDPLKMMAKDLFLQLLLAGWGITFFILLYAHKMPKW